MKWLQDLIAKLFNTGTQNAGEYASTPTPTNEYSPTPTPTSQPQFGRVSYYLPTGGLTATGTTPVSGYSAAISRQLLGDIPMGSLIKLPNGNVVRVEDLTNEDIKDTLDLFYSTNDEATFPEKGLMRDVPYSVVGRDTTGMKYNY
jgi:3D (Asp-Asp-Asp) domain-containing protein